MKIICVYSIILKKNNANFSNICVLFRMHFSKQTIIEIIGRTFRQMVKWLQGPTMEKRGMTFCQIVKWLQGPTKERRGRTFRQIVKWLQGPTEAENP